MVFILANKAYNNTPNYKIDIKIQYLYDIMKVGLVNLSQGVLNAPCVLMSAFFLLSYGKPSNPVTCIDDGTSHKKYYPN